MLEKLATKASKESVYRPILERARSREFNPSEGGDELVDDLVAVLGDFTPPGYYFGLHLARDAFGFWPLGNS